MNVTHCKTVLVRFTQHGHYGYINAAEFDAAQHERADEVPATPAAAPAPAPTAPTTPAGDGGAVGGTLDPAPHPIHGMNADAAKDYAATLASVDDVKQAQAAEYAHPRFPGGRTSVLKSLDAAMSAALQVAANATAQ